MNFNSIFGSVLQSLIYKPIQKAGLWAARQTLGKDSGNAAAPVVDAIAQSAAGNLVAHLSNDKLAQQIGIPTTEQALVGAAQSVLGGTSTLDLDHQNLLTDFLQQSIVRATAPAAGGN